MARKMESGQVAVLVPPDVETISLLAMVREAARDAGGELIGMPERRDHGIFNHDGTDVDLRKAGLHAVIFTMERPA